MALTTVPHCFMDKTWTVVGSGDPAVAGELRVSGRAGSWLQSDLQQVASPLFNQHGLALGARTLGVYAQTCIESFPCRPHPLCFLSLSGAGRSYAVCLCSTLEGVSRYSWDINDGCNSATLCDEERKPDLSLNPA